MHKCAQALLINLSIEIIALWFTWKCVCWCYLVWDKVTNKSCQCLYWNLSELHAVLPLNNTPPNNNQGFLKRMLLFVYYKHFWIKTIPNQDRILSAFWVVVIVGYFVFICSLSFCCHSVANVAHYHHLSTKCCTSIIYCISKLKWPLLQNVILEGVILDPISCGWYTVEQR